MTDNEPTAVGNPEPRQSGGTGNGEPNTLETVLSYLAVLFRYKWLIISITVLAAIGVVAYSIMSLRLPPEESPLPNYYEAYATLLVSEEPSSGTAQAMLSALGISPGAGGSMNYGQLAQMVFTSRSFLDRVIEENDIIEKYNISEPVRTRSRKLLLGASSVDYDSRTSVLTVSYQDIDPVFARDMANSIVEELQEWFRSRGGLTRMEELRSLENKIAEVEGEIARLESEIQAFQREHGVLNVEEIAQTQSNMLADLQSQLVDLEVQIRNQETFSRIDDDPALARLRAQRDNVIELIDQIEQGYTGGARTMPARNQLPELALEFRRLQTDLEIQQRIYQAVSEQYEVVRLTAEAGPAFTVLELAEIPEEKAGPSRGQLSMKVTIFAFAASVALAYLIHFARVLWSDHETRRIIGETLGWGRKRDSSRDA